MAKTITITKSIATIDDFKKEIKHINKKGYIQTRRSGDTGIGKTLEDELGIQENCIAAADLGTVELKAARNNSSSMLTLTTKSPDKRGANSKLRDKYGYKTDESIELNPNLNILHSTVNGQDFNTLNGQPFLKLSFEADKMYLEHYDDGILDNIYWSEKSLTKAFKKKFPEDKLYYVKANSKIIGGKEHFEYNKAYLLEGFDSKELLKNIQAGVIDVDIRIGIFTEGKKKGKSHDHGTAIRINPSKLDLCFKKKTKLL